MTRYEVWHRELDDAGDRHWHRVSTNHLFVDAIELVGKLPQGWNLANTTADDRQVWRPRAADWKIVEVPGC